MTGPLVGGTDHLLPIEPGRERAALDIVAAGQADAVGDLGVPVDLVGDRAR